VLATLQDFALTPLTKKAKHSSRRRSLIGGRTNG
jgi:hypothetical protein